MRKMIMYVFISLFLISGSLCIWFFSYTSELNHLKEDINKRAQGNIVNPGFLFARFYYFSSGTFTKNSYKEYIESLDISADDTIMNFGCGPGAEALALSEILEKGNGQLCCLDISQTWIDIAKIRLKAKKNTAFIFGDITKMKLEEEQYNAIIINFVLHDIPSGIRKNVMEALYKIIKKGGKIFLNEPYDDSHGISSEEIEKIMINAGFEKKSIKKISKLLGLNSNSYVYKKAVKNVPKQLLR